MSDITPRPKAFIKKPIATPKGHEAFLKALEAAGAVVNIALVSSSDAPPMKGTIKHSDKYTISLKVDRADGSYQVFVVFKHAIECFWTNPEDQAKAA
jgi:sRNA-binding regulator protein Hfq